MPAKLQPGSELWLSGIAEGESVGTVLGPNDRHLLVAIALKAFAVRSLQREFFKTKSYDTLKDSKAAERELDALLSTPAQGGLGL